MSRLPVVGGDANAWGSILNDFASVSLNADGTLQKGAQAFTAANVKGFGATGNGSTDDTTAIKNAIASISTSFDGTGTGGVVVFPPGTYKITSVIEVPPSVLLKGLSGRGNSNNPTLFKSHDGVAVRLVRRNAAPGNLFHLGGVEDLQFTGNGAADTTASKFIELGDSSAVNTSTGAWNLFISRCYFSTTSGYGIYSAHSQEALIDGNYFVATKFPIYYNTVVASARITRNTLLDQTLIAGAIGMQFRPGSLGGAAGLQIWGNYSLNFQTGIWLTSIAGASIRDNVIEGAQKWGLVLERFLSDEVTGDGLGCLSFAVEGNTFINWAANGVDNPAIRLNYSRYGVIGLNVYQSPNGASTHCITVFDDGVNKTEKNLIVEPVLTGTGTAAPFQANNSALQQNTLLGRNYWQLAAVAGDVNEATFGGGEQGRMWWDNTNKRLRFWKNGTTLKTATVLDDGGGVTSTTIGAGVGSLRMSSANPATNTRWIPFTDPSDGTQGWIPWFTTNSP